MRQLVFTRALVLALLLLVGGAWSLAAQAAGERWTAPERRARRANPVAADAASIQRGREVYRRECSNCHGATGNNDGRDTTGMSAARRLGDATLQAESDGALFWKISEGRDPMPSSSETLTEQERWAVVNFLRTLRRPAGARP